jgi:ATP-dependent protease Clp ATPase subunit
LAGSLKRATHCSFCGKSYTKVKGRMVDGPGVYICAGCVELCVEVLEEQKRVERGELPLARQRANWATRLRDFWHRSRPSQATTLS